MSTVDTSSALPAVVQGRVQNTNRYALARAPIVPPGSVAGKSLTLVIAIMCFLTSITAGGVYLVFQATNIWTNNISSEVTVQVQQPGDVLDTKMLEITKFLNDQNGIKRVTPFTQEQSLKLVEPWIGRPDILKEFAIPRLIAVVIDRGNPPDMPLLKRVVETKFPGTYLDDHGLWRGEIRRLTRIVEISGLGVILLMTAATIGVIIAAARSALASNREIVEVLHLVGAEEKFIARQFERHFLFVGIKAGIMGVGLAGLIFTLLPYIAPGLESTVTSTAELKRFIGAGTLDTAGYALLIGVVFLIAGLCKMTSRYGVRHILNQHAPV
jgi:cell division transport system permease protein